MMRDIWSLRTILICFSLIYIIYNSFNRFNSSRTLILNHSDPLPPFLEPFSSHLVQLISSCHQVTDSPSSISTHHSTTSLFHVQNLYLSCFDHSEDMNVPLWTIHSIHSNSLSDQYSRRPNVYEWSSPPSLMHIPGTPFQSVGQIHYDRGHLVPCGDFTTFSEKYETFNIINRAPQLSQNNQGVWNQLEQALRNAIDQVAAQNNVHVEAIVVTRPLYDKKYNFQITNTKGINSIRTQIPFSFNKAVLIYYDGTLREAFCLSVLNRIVEHSSNFMNFIKDFSQCDNRVKEGIVINSFSVGQVFNFIKNEMQKRSYQHPTPRRDDSYKTNSVRTWNGFWNTYSSKAYGWWKNTKRYFRKNRRFFFPRRRRRQAKWKRPYQRRNRYEYHNQHRRRRRRY